MDNDAVLILKKTTKNQTLARAFVSGVVTDTYANKSSHDHFEIMIGKDKTEVLEVVYNNEFGDLPPIRLGMRVEACGDYITSNAKTAQYPASPAGAIIHWVHDNPKSGHEDGFLRIDGTIYGNSYKQAKPSKPAAPPKRAKKPGKPKEVFAEMTALY